MISATFCASFSDLTARID